MSVLFTPHVTVARGHLLIVEETINDKPTWNQPAGHLEADETLIQAARRELTGETGICASPQYFPGVQQWLAPDNTPFLRSLFALVLPQRCPVIPQDADIDRCWWLTPSAILQARNLRSPRKAASVRLWQSDVRYLLSLLQTF